MTDSPPQSSLSIPSWILRGPMRILTGYLRQSLNSFLDTSLSSRSLFARPTSLSIPSWILRPNPRPVFWLPPKELSIPSWILQSPFERIFGITPDHSQFLPGYFSEVYVRIASDRAALNSFLDTSRERKKHRNISSIPLSIPSWILQARVARGSSRTQYTLNSFLDTSRAVD